MIGAYVVRKKGFRGPGHLVSGVDWMPGTARAPVSLSHYSDGFRVLPKSLQRKGL